MNITESDYMLPESTVDRSGAGRFTLPDVFAAAAAAGGDGPAVFCADGFRSWARWRTEADALARGLQEAGVGPGDVVAVHLPNCWEFLVAHVAYGSIVGWAVRI